MSSNDIKEKLIQSVEDAYKSKQALSIQGNNSKEFFGNKITGESINVVDHSGIVEYEPSELFITARCGTLIQDIESILQENNQILSFEPPSFSTSDTLGGLIACGLSGPRRAYSSSIRDCVLGTHIINGKAEYLEFGGKVMKNVAGYDTSRLMCGALGTLGIIMQASLRVSPKPQHELTTVIECSQTEAISKLHYWTQSHLPITASFHFENQLYIRLEGLQITVLNSYKKIGGEALSSSESFWKSIKNHQHDFFKSEMPLWKLLVPHNSPALSIAGDMSIEWNGGLRWLLSNEANKEIMDACTQARGTATLFKTASKPENFLPNLSPNLKKLHINLKNAFDPENILNPGRQYSWC